MLNRKFIVLLAVVAILVAGFAVTANPAKAATSLVSIDVGCSSVTFTFTTDQSATQVHGAVWVGVSTYLVSSYFASIPGPGTNTVTINYTTPQPAGTQINISYHVEVSPYENIVSGTYTCGGDYVGPAIPDGWVQHWMACSSAVFDAPGGQPVGNDAVWAGQSFYVNPEPKLDASGKSWSQVFVSSVVSPWIPTSCVK